jgi:hypothetical protein
MLKQRMIVQKCIPNGSVIETVDEQEGKPKSFD